MEKVGVFNTFFTSVFTGEKSIQEPQAPETGKAQGEVVVSLVEEDQVREHSELYTCPQTLYVSTDPGEM